VAVDLVVFAFGLNRKKLLQALLTGLFKHHGFGAGPVEGEVTLGADDDVVVSAVGEHLVVLAGLWFILGGYSVRVHILV
jgi:hypothetical protein